MKERSPGLVAVAKPSSSSHPWLLLSRMNLVRLHTCFRTLPIVHLVLLDVVCLGRSSRVSRIALLCFIFFIRWFTHKVDIALSNDACIWGSRLGTSCYGSALQSFGRPKRLSLLTFVSLWSSSSLDNGLELAYFFVLFRNLHYSGVDMFVAALGGVKEPSEHSGQ
jgi:hypothetical protein